MSVISTIFDPQITQTPIYVPLKAPTETEMTGGNNAAVAQTTVHGVCTPIVCVNNIVFDFDKVLKMTLYNNSRLPELDLLLWDDQNLLSSIDNPRSDNEVRLQILPSFENAYKKINLTFYITNINIKETRVSIQAIYKIPDLYISRLKCFGKINSFDLFKTIASECKLGFASNCETNDIDKRYVYCDNISYESLMSREIQTSGSQNLVYDYWIDLWNYLNFVNIYERLNSKDSQDDMQIWTLNTPGDIIDSFSDIKPVLQDAIITNHPEMKSELQTNKFVLSNSNIKNKLKGTDRVYTIYKDGVNIDSLVEDGNIHNDVFTKYYYLGENIGEYEYLTASSIREGFIDIIDKNSIEVTLNSPTFGLYRGSHVRFNWYDNNYFQKQSIKELGGDMNTDDGQQNEELIDDNKLMLNKQLSGEYLIYKMIFNYNKGVWNVVLTLVKPEDQIKTYMP